MSINKFGFKTSAVNDSDFDDKMLLELDNFVKSNGGSMTGTLNMNKNRIMNLANPTESLDAATKKYVDNKTRLGLNAIKTYIDTELVKLNVKDSNDNIDGKNKQIKNVAEPTESNDVITKSYFERMNRFEQREYKLKIPVYERTRITGELKLLSTQIQNLYILVGKLTIISDVHTRLLNIAEMTHYFTEYQYLTRCVRYIQCGDPVTVNQFLDQAIVDILIKDNNIFLVSGMDQIKIIIV
jgi:outer membrane receptor for Fe3+-dicitrate